MADFDVAVIGLGAAGSAALNALAGRGVRVVGFERHRIGHDQGSSHGETRMIRLGYFEHPSYVPLLRRAYHLWRELEAASGERLLHITGIAEIGRPDSEVVTGTLRASRDHALPHEVLGVEEAMRRFPAFRLPADFICVHQPDGGFVEVERTLAVLNRFALAQGAVVHEETSVTSITPRQDDVVITTKDAQITASRVIIAAGAWASSLLPGRLPYLRPTRQVMTWFEPRDAAPFERGRFPVFLLETEHGVHYGFPPHGDGCVKIAKHHHADETTDPDRMDRAISHADEAMIRAALSDYIPAADGALARAKTCIYTMTPDGDFVIDRLPDAPHVVVASACSGHGFKFAPVLGEILADLALKGETAHDLARFSMRRFASN